MTTWHSIWLLWLLWLVIGTFGLLGPIGPVLWWRPVLFQAPPIRWAQARSHLHVGTLAEPKDLDLRTLCTFEIIWVQIRKWTVVAVYGLEGFEHVPNVCFCCSWGNHGLHHPRGSCWANFLPPRTKLNWTCLVVPVWVFKMRIKRWSLTGCWQVPWLLVPFQQVALLWHSERSCCHFQGTFCCVTEPYKWEQVVELLKSKRRDKYSWKSFSSDIDSAFVQVPLAGWIQIFGYCAYCEISAGYDADVNKRTPGDMGWNPPIFSGNDPETKTRRLNAELANGRLAMMAIIGMFFQAWWLSYVASEYQ